MSNVFQDFTASLLDYATLPTNAMGLAAAPFTGTQSFLRGDGFWNGAFDNPFFDYSQNIRDMVTNVTGADENSFIRNFGADIPLVVASGGASLGVKAGLKALKGAKLASRGGKFTKEGKELLAESKQIAKSALKEAVNPQKALNNLGNYAIANAALGLVTSSDSPDDSFWRGAAGLALGAKGLKRLKDYKTKTDLTPLTENERLQRTVDTFLEKDRKAEFRASTVDARGGTLDFWTQNKIVDENLATTLSKSATDNAAMYPEMQRISNLVDELNKKYNTVAMQTKYNDFGALNGTMGARVGGYRELLQTGFRDKTNEFFKKMGISRNEAAKLLPELKGTVEEQFEKLIPYLNKLPEQGTKGLSNISNEKLLADFKVLQKELGEQHFLNSEMKGIARNTVGLALKNGLIDLKQYNKYIKDIDNGIYVPMRSDEVRDVSNVIKSSNPFENKRHPLMSDSGIALQGVDYVTNLLPVFVSKIQSELEAVARNVMIKETMPNLEKAINSTVPRIDKSIRRLREIGDSDRANALQAYKKKFGEVYYRAITEQDIRNRMSEVKAKGRHISKEQAFDDLRRKYLDKGLYELKTYENGEAVYSYVPQNFKNIFEQRAVNNSTFNKIVVATNRLFTGTISGAYNIFFLPKRLLYPEGEMLPALRKALAKEGIDIGVLPLLRIYWQAIKESAMINFKLTMRDAIKDDVILGGFARGNRQKYIDDVDRLIKDNDVMRRAAEYNLIQNDSVGHALRNLNGTVDISLMPDNMNKLLMGARNFKRGFDNTSLGRILFMLKDVADEAAVRTALKVSDTYDIKDIIVNGKLEPRASRFMREVNRHLSDVRRRGTGDTVMGKIANAIQDFMPYGATSLQSIVGKLEYLPKDIMSNSKFYAKRALQANNGSYIETGFDMLGKVGQQLAQLPDNVVFDTIWKTVALPATICYLWNYGNEDNARYYNSLQPYERSNKFQLVNFAGEGINVSVPLDQEWSVVKNLYEIMLEGLFGLGESYDRGNPDFSMRDQLIWSLGQEFGISLPVIAEGAINLAGYKTNFDVADIVGNGNSPIEKINPYKYHTLDEGVATAMMSITGKLGKILVNLAEDKPAMDYRYAIPFLQVNPKQKPASDTVSFLNQQLKLNPTPELQKWARHRQYILADMKYYENNGMTKQGEILGSIEDVRKMYLRQIDDITKKAYEKVISS